MVLKGRTQSPEDDGMGGGRRHRSPLPTTESHRGCRPIRPGGLDGCQGPTPCTEKKPEPRQGEGLAKGHTAHRQ